MTTPRLIDLRNLFDPEHLNALGFSYSAIGYTPKNTNHTEAANVFRAYDMRMRWWSSPRSLSRRRMCLAAHVPGGHGVWGMIRAQAPHRWQMPLSQGLTKAALTSSTLDVSPRPLCIGPSTTWPATQPSWSRARTRHPPSTASNSLWAGARLWRSSANLKRDIEQQKFPHQRHGAL